MKRIRLYVKLQKAAIELVSVHGLPLTIFGFEAFRELTQLIFKKIDISFNPHNAVEKLKFAGTFVKQKISKEVNNKGTFTNHALC